MDSVLRAVFVYLFLLLIFRIAGKRTLAETTTFDFVLLLIVAEATQQALIDTDNSLTNAVIVVATLIWLDIALSIVAQRLPRLDRVVNGLPIVLIEDGHLLRDRMHKARVDESDLLEAAHDKQGLERLDQVKYAILERNGSISIIPRSG